MYSSGVLFGTNCTALDQSELSNFVECTIKSEILQRSVAVRGILSVVMTAQEQRYLTSEIIYKTPWAEKN